MTSGIERAAETIRARDSLLRSVLLADRHLVGGIYHMDYQQALVISNDAWKHTAGGVPFGCFLLATTLNPDDIGADPDAEEVLLLRVVGTASLPREAELIETRESAIRLMIEHGDRDPSDPGIIDVLTRNQIQFNAFDCQILGTFYETVDGSDVRVEWGSDIDTLYAASRYLVYKPVGRSLEYVASYPVLAAASLQEPPSQPVVDASSIILGHVRYATTVRRARASGHDQVPVHVRIDDFIANKTAVFGMTRTGKSNTMKTLAAAVFRRSQQTGEPIGQLLFDPHGEYANPNPQDAGMALADIGPAHVTIYQFGADGSNNQVKPLQINFFDENQLDAARQIMASVLSSDGADYVKTFLDADYGYDLHCDGEMNRSQAAHAQRGRLALYATLLRAGFQPPDGFHLRCSMTRDLANTIAGEEDFPGTLTTQYGHVRIAAHQLQPVMDYLLTHASDEDVSKFTKGESFQAAKAFYEPGSRSGYRKLTRIRPFHNPAASADPADQIYDDLAAGRIVICDLHFGDDGVIQVLSERIVHRIVDRQNERFVNNQDLHRIQIFVEEAHRLFATTRFDRDTGADPYVRLAKEASKFKIGLIYATQEVSGVDARILSNTGNWVIAHLNNDREIRELSKYYDFGVFADSIRSSEEKGFVRLRTQSGYYTVPTQIRLFDQSMLDDAIAAGS